MEMEMEMEVDSSSDGTTLTQGSDAWHAARRGKVTASILGTILGFTERFEKGRRQIAFDNLRTELGGGISPPFVHNEAMRWGTTHEINGVEAYSAIGAKFNPDAELYVQPTGLHIHPQHPWLAASPDGLVGTEGAIEVKCPFNPLRTLSEAPYSWCLYDSYIAQINCVLETLGRDWCDFIRWKQNSVLVVRIKRDPGLFATLLPYYESFYASANVQGASLPPLTDDNHTQINDALKRHRATMCSIVAETPHTGLFTRAKDGPVLFVYNRWSGKMI